MASVKVNTAKDGSITSYRWRGRLYDNNGRQSYITKTVAPPINLNTGEPLPPKAALKQMQRAADEWEDEMRKNKSCTKKYGFKTFVKEIWIPRHVLNPDEDHTPSTIQFYENMVKRPIEYFADKDIRTITTPDIADFLFSISQVHQANGKPLSAKTRKSIRQTLYSIFDYARKNKFVATNPVEDAPTVKREKKAVTYLTKDDIVDFKKYLEQVPTKWKAMMYILLYCGLRRGEVTALTWADIDLEARTLRVVQNVTYIRNPEDGNHIHIGRPKTPASIRTVPFGNEVKDALISLRYEQKQIANEIGTCITDKSGDIQPGVFLFNMSVTGSFDFFQPMSPMSVTAWLSDFSQQYELPHIHPHMLRHTTGTMLAQSGINARDGASFLGQSNVGVFFENYVGTDQRQMRGAADALAQHISSC